LATSPGPIPSSTSSTKLRLGSASFVKRSSRTSANDNAPSLQRLGVLPDEVRQVDPPLRLRVVEGKHADRECAGGDAGDLRVEIVEVRARCST
jgi:hypothetical protein